MEKLAQKFREYIGLGKKETVSTVMKEREGVEGFLLIHYYCPLHEVFTGAFI